MMIDACHRQHCIAVTAETMMRLPRQGWVLRITGQIGLAATTPNRRSMD